MGFDIDPIVIQLCKERGIVNAVVESYDNLDRFAPADTILWLNRTICTAGTIPRIRALLESSRKTASQQGVLILESVEGRPALANRGAGVLENTLYFRYGGQIGPPFTRTYFSSNIAEVLLGETGWRHLQIIRREDTYIAVARKKDGLRTNA
jgi:hypothetical protein